MPRKTKPNPIEAAHERSRPAPIKALREMDSVDLIHWIAHLAAKHAGIAVVPRYIGLTSDRLRAELLSRNGEGKPNAR